MVTDVESAMALCARLPNVRDITKMLNATAEKLPMTGQRVSLSA